MHFEVVIRVLKIQCLRQYHLFLDSIHISVNSLAKVVMDDRIALNPSSLRN